MKHAWLGEHSLRCQPVQQASMSLTDPLLWGCAGIRCAHGCHPVQCVKMCNRHMTGRGVRIQRAGLSSFDDGREARKPIQAAGEQRGMPAAVPAAVCRRAQALCARLTVLGI